MAGNLAGMAFIPYYHHLMDLLETNEELKKTGTGILNQTFWAAAWIMVGGVLKGRLGAMLGGILGSIVAYFTTEEYDSLVRVINNLTDSEKELLVKKVKKLVRSTAEEDLTSFIASKKNQERLIKVLKGFK